MKKNSQRLLTLFIILIILAGILLLENNLSKFISQNPSLIFPELKKQDVNEIDIQTEKNQTKIYKNKGRWLIKKDGVEYRGDADRVNKIIDSFSSLIKGDIASKNKNNFLDLGVSKQKITLVAKNKSFSLYIGNNFSVDKNYVRVDDENEVFEASGVSDLLTPYDFRDLNVHFIADENNVSYVEINFAGKQIILQKKNREWQIDNKKTIKERVDFFLNDLKTLKSTDLFIKDPMGDNYYPETLTIEIKEGSNEKTATFFQKDTNNFYLKTSNSNLIFQIPDAYVSSFKKEEKDFVE